MQRTRCELVALTLVALSFVARCPAAPTVVALNSREPDASHGAENGKLLVREIVRQAVLIAARDELGLSTRDMTLRETMPAADDFVCPLDLQITANPPFWLRVRLGLTDEKKTTVYEQQIEFAKPLELDVFDYATFVEKCEVLSRGDFVEALKKAGLAVKSQRAAGDSEVSAETARQLLEMNIFSQFAAVRGLHAQHRIEGASPRTLAAISQGYANLGRLTFYHWNASHKAFLARALLYAQRLVNLDRASAWSLRQRAYVETMSGLHAAALADLERAAAADKEKPPTAEPPAWLPLAEALCRYDREAIQAVKSERLRELAAFCSYLVVENSNCEGNTLRVGRAALEIVPECYAICDSMGRFRGVNNLHFTTVHGPMTLLKTLRDRLGELPGLPPSVARELEKTVSPQKNDDPAWAAGAQRAALIAMLVEQGSADNDDHELSWEMMGRLIEDMTFLHVYRRVEFFARHLGLPLQSYQPQFNAALAMVSKYPYANTLMAIVLDPQRNAAQIKDLLAKMQWVDAGWAQHNDALVLTLPVQATGAGVSRATVQATFSHSDHVAQDLEESATSSRKPETARQLQVVSPRSPQAVALLAMYDPTIRQAQLQEWERDFAAHAPVFKGLATRYQRLGQATDAQRCLQRYVELAPDQWGFESLANNYWQQKQPEKWKETLDESLKHEDFALSHARTRVAIARYFMGRKQWTDALPYADAAAQSGAAWAMICASECYECLEQWEPSEQWIKLTAQRYPGQQLDWYFWCCRTGHGDMDSANRLALQTATKLAQSNLPNDLELLGTYFLVSGKNEMARTAFRKSHERSNSPWPGMHWAMLNAQAKDEEGRDAALASVISRVKDYRPPKNYDNFADLVALARWLNNTLHQPDGKEPDMESLEAICAQSPRGRPNVEFFAGCFFRDIGQPELAHKFWQRSIDSGNRSYWNDTIARKWLREAAAKVEPEPAQEPVQE